jgi:hypothetical protein
LKKNPLHEKYRDLKKEVESKEIEVRVVEDSCMCQSILDEVRLSSYTTSHQRSASFSSIIIALSFT